MLAKNISSIAPPKIKVTASPAYPKSFLMDRSVNEVRNLMQWGCTKVTVQFSRLMSCWTWDCVWGCAGWDHEGEQEATEAFLSHDCVGSRVEPHGGLAWTPDEVIEEGQARLRESHPEVWDAWLEWCKNEPCS